MRVKPPSTGVPGRDDAFALTRALGAFQRTLLQGGNRHEQGLLNEAELRGAELFDAHCQSCHSGFNYTNYEFVSVGMYTVYAPDSGRARITGSADVSADNNVAVVADSHILGVTVTGGLSIGTDKAIGISVASTDIYQRKVEALNGLREK